jgi:SAM-dependent methyltransferase
MMLVTVAVLAALLLGWAQPSVAQVEGPAALERFLQWKSASGLEFGDALKKYREFLKQDGVTDAVADRTIRLIVAYDEAALYDRVYSGSPEFNTKPNQLLVDAVDGMKPGKALDVGMGQGRNALFLARQGWEATGFDVAEVGLRRATEQAAAAGLRLDARHASDDEFDFGHERWDLIAIIYALEKRSVHRVRDALKPGGFVVVEAGLTGPESSEHPFAYHTNELREIFKGFRILRYEERSGTYDWGPETIRLVRLIAQKPR